MADFFEYIMTQYISTLKNDKSPIEKQNKMTILIQLAKNPNIDLLRSDQICQLYMTEIIKYKLDVNPLRCQEPVWAPGTRKGLSR